MKRILSFLILTALLLSLFAIGISAEESESYAEPVTEGETDKPSDNETADTAYPDEIYKVITDNIGEIFSFLAFAFSGILMLCYKKGILPLIKGGISALSGGVSALSEEAKKQSESSNGISLLLEKRLCDTDEILTKMKGSLELMESKLSSSEKNEKDNEIMRTVLLEEVNMLYEVFMAATLPEYQKERIAKQVGAMRERLTSDNGGEDEEN